jgi:enamine deaminase RidA (YjgF/YER057c/UK114 family)
MSVHLVRSSRLFPGVPYAYAAVAGPAGLVFTAGACPLDEHGQVTAPGNVAAQARQAVANLRTALEDSGATLADVIKTTVLVASSERGDLVAAWDEVAAAFGDHDAPSTLLGVTVLGYPDQLVEIEAIAIAPAQPVALQPPLPACPHRTPPRRRSPTATARIMSIARTAESVLARSRLATTCWRADRPLLVHVPARA